MYAYSPLLSYMTAAIQLSSRTAIPVAPVAMLRLSYATYMLLDAQEAPRLHATGTAPWHTALLVCEVCGAS